jgi:hypothetical protein
MFNRRPGAIFTLRRNRHPMLRIIALEEVLVDSGTAN